MNELSKLSVFDRFPRPIDRPEHSFLGFALHEIKLSVLRVFVCFGKLCAFLSTSVEFAFTKAVLHRPINSSQSRKQWRCLAEESIMGIWSYNSSVLLSLLTIPYL